LESSLLSSERSTGCKTIGELVGFRGLERSGLSNPERLRDDGSDPEDATAVLAGDEIQGGVCMPTGVSIRTLVTLVGGCRGGNTSGKMSSSSSIEVAGAEKTFSTVELD